MSLPLHIRPATEADLPAITEIYNFAVLNTTATFDTEPKTIEDRRNWLRNRDMFCHPVLVGELDDTVIGWASLSPWSDKKGYDTTAEASLYIHPDHQRSGHGRQLMEALLSIAAPACLHLIIGRIEVGNTQSLQLSMDFGFQQYGILPEAGFKFGRFLDVAIVGWRVEEADSFQE